MKKHSWLGVGVASLAGMLSAYAAEATTSTFDSLSDPRINFPIRYIESGYTILSLTTQYDPQSNRTLNRTLFTESLISGSSCTNGATAACYPAVSFQPNSSFELTGGTFTFQGFDGYFGSNSDDSSAIRRINVIGSLAGVQLFSASIGNVPTPGKLFPFISAGSGSMVFDKLTFTTGSLARANVFLDNIMITAGDVPPPVVIPPAAAVPEPATWAMMIAGFGLVGAIRRRQASAMLSYAA